MSSTAEHACTRRSLLFATALTLVQPALSSLHSGPFPSPRQLRWHQLEFYGFLHFTVNTFTGKEWGEGDEDPSIFNPTAFDPDQIVSALKNAGMKGVILTCKHHDGFCLWPTATTDHCIRSSSWRGGKGDVVKDISEAANRHGLKFGIYLSPWDRNSALYGKPEYIAFYRRQLTELLQNYGPIFEIWHDGANGGTGYYGGAREKRTIDKHSYYDWPNTWALARRLQPDAVIFSDAGPDIRWVGNEKGIAGDPCWATFTPVAENGGPGVPGDTKESENNSGTRNGQKWMPAECDVSIRPGWFWHENENERVKSPLELLDLYNKSVGRGASFLLNVPPTRAGQLHENDVASLRGFGGLLRSIFKTDLAAGARLQRRGDQIIEYNLRRPTTFNLIRLREDIRQGQRISAVSIEASADTSWQPVASSTSIGACRLIQLDQPVTATRLRLKVLASSAPPRISEFALFHHTQQA